MRGPRIGNGATQGYGVPGAGAGSLSAGVLRCARQPPMRRRSSSSTGGVGRSQTTWRRAGSPSCSPTPAGRSSASTCSATARRRSPRPGGLRRPDGADRRRPARPSRSTPSASRSARSRLLRLADPAARAVPPASSSPASAATCSSATTSGGERILAGVEGTADPDDNLARLFGQYADQPGNDRRRPRRGDAAARRGRRSPPEQLAAVDVPGARRDRRPRLRRARPTSSSRRCPTPGCVVAAQRRPLRHAESFGFIDAALEFLDAVP